LVGLVVLGLLAPAHVYAETLSSAFYYLSPLPDSRLVSSQTTLIFRATDEFEARQRDWTQQVSVLGSASGTHQGRWIRSRDNRTVIFEPDQPFTHGETVRVLVASGTDAQLSYTFTVRESPVVQNPPRRLCECLAPPGYEQQQQETRPAPPAAVPGELPDDFPNITVTVNSNPSPGYIFISNFSFPGVPGSAGVGRYGMILDNSGTPVYYRRTDSFALLDFKVLSPGRLCFIEFTDIHYTIMDSTYTIVDSVGTIGYPIDFHDIIEMPNGHFLVFGQENHIEDMSGIVAGGDTAANIIDIVIQELDVDRNVVFQWRTIDHYSVLDATHEDLTSDNIDYVHPNSLEIDNDGHILMSNRHMDEVTKINRTTGEIIWRMGGKNNDFTLLGDTLWFSHQHTAYILPNGNLTLFDNGNWHDPRESRAIEYDVDDENLTMTRVWEYRNIGQFGSAMGITQRLPGGNTLIGWGNSNPNVTEVRPDGSKAFELTFDAGAFSYRAFRLDWEDAISPTDSWYEIQNDYVLLHFDTTGAGPITHYNVYADTTDGAMARVDSVTTSPVLLDMLTRDKLYRIGVSAVLEGGYETGFGETVTTYTPALPEPYTLAQNQPNPFNPSTTIPFGLPRDTHVKIVIYDVRGAMVRNLLDEDMRQGKRSVVWDGTDDRGQSVASGVYFYRLSTESFMDSKKMVLVK